MKAARARSSSRLQELFNVMLWIAMTNLFNRLNVTIREPAGTTWGG